MKKFTDTIIEDAKEQNQKMLLENEKEKSNRIKKAEEEILNNIFTDIKQQISDIKNNFSRDLSKKSLEIRNELLAKREQLTSMVFLKLKDKLISFTKSNEYKDYLIISLKKNTSEINNNSLEILVCEKDKLFFEGICNILNLNAVINVNENILIGGYILLCNDKALKFDESLDEKLILSREYFNEISELVII